MPLQSENKLTVRALAGAYALSENGPSDGGGTVREGRLFAPYFFSSSMEISIGLPCHCMS